MMERKELDVVTNECSCTLKKNSVWMVVWVIRCFFCCLLNPTWFNVWVALRVEGGPKGKKHFIFQ
jgi:hypothetical protein